MVLMGLHSTLDYSSAPGTGERPVEIVSPAGYPLRGYLRDGDGAVGMFVHGFRSHCGGEKALAFARHAAVRDYPWLRFDLGGHGASGGEFSRFRLSALLADLEAVLDFVGERPVVLAGSSMGGWLATLAALRRPRQVAGLLLIAPAFNFIQNRFGALPPDMLARWREAGSLSFEDPYGGEPFRLEYGVIDDAARHDVLEPPPVLGCPVRILHGERDEAVPLATSREFVARARAQSITLTVVPDGDHRLNAAIPLMTAAVDELWQQMDRPQ
jgi:abhydrolase domain-containing protein 10